MHADDVCQIRRHGAHQRNHGLCAIRSCTMTHAGILCAIAAATHWQVPADGVLAVYEIENGSDGQWVRNANGTYDVGPMQFNTAYLATLRKWGIRPEDVAATGTCYAFELAAWRIRMQIQKGQGDLWQRIAYYHSTSPTQVSQYRARLMRHARRWRRWLEENFKTVAIESDGTHEGLALR